MSEAAVARVERSRPPVEEWALVLASAGIECRIEEVWLEDGPRWALLVDAAELDRAHEALGAYDRESRSARAGVREEEAPQAGSGALGVLLAAVLLAFFYVTGDRTPGVVWFERGAARAEWILAGQWWRAVTALTLHADLAHVAGNAVACLVFVTAVGRWVGAGLGAWLVLGSGVLGNLATAWLHRAGHSSVGASTATFGALGILGALQLSARRRRLSGRRAVFTVVAATLALLGLLGTSKGADVMAHLFGLVAGALLGLLGGRLPRRWYESASSGAWLAQGALGLSALGAVAACWWLALG